LECIALAIEIDRENIDLNKDFLITKHTIKENNFNSKFKILLVEDNTSNQKFTAKILSKAGFICDIASNGIEAIESYKNKKYNLILMDCQMPVMDGYEATKEIRNIEKCEEIIGENPKHIPIIALTAHAMQGDIDKCLSFGMDDYVSKPIDDKKFIETIKKYLHLISTNDQEAKKFSLINTIVSKIVNQAGFTEQEAREVLNEYLEEIPLMIENLSKAVSEEDYSLIITKAHLLKGSSANLRIYDLNELALKLEDAAKSEDIFLCDMLLKEIQEYTLFLQK